MTSRAKITLQANSTLDFSSCFTSLPTEDRDHARLTFDVGLGMVVWSSVTGRIGPFFCSTRAASILPFSNRRHERKHFLSCRLAFLLGPFLLFDRAAGFLLPRPRISDADARRSCQGRPSLSHRGALRRFQAAP
jgi:hypothetical protein